MRVVIGRSLVVLVGLGVAGCTELDPLTSSNRWNPTGVNEANLLAQVADPNDLVTGRGVTGADGQLAAAAVTRLRRDHVKALPDVGLTTLQLGSPATPSASDPGGEP